MNDSLLTWRDTKIMASGHSVVVCLVPYPMVCWVSRENRKQEEKSWTSRIQAVLLEGASGSKSPWT